MCMIFMAWNLILVKAQVRKINAIFVSGVNSNNKKAYKGHKFGKIDIVLILVIQK